MVADLKVILFLQVALVVGVPLFFWGPLRIGRVFPLPIIQIFAGIALGPSVFGALAPDAFSFFFHKGVLAGVDTLSNVALVLFVFLAGCELDRQVLRNAGGFVVRVGVAGVIVPWIAGAAAAWGLINLYGADQLVGRLGNPIIFAVAFGLCMAVTALPVLVVVLRELGFNQKPIGTIALAIGGIDDALLWSSLAVLLPFAAGSSEALSAFFVAAGGAVLTAAALHFAITPYLRKMIERQAPERFLISVAIIVLFAFAALNEATQLHAAIGAFLTGLLLPDELREHCQDRLDTPVTLLLLPFLFLATGLKTSFSFTDPMVWMIVAAAMVVCVGGKFAGIALPAIAGRERAPFAVTLGVLMQCKGLMEIVVVTVLYQKGVFGQTVFSALILVALISTAATVPLARLCQAMFGEAATTPRTREMIAPASPTVTHLPAGTKSPALIFDDLLGTVLVDKPEVIIGRHSSDDVRIDDIRISRHHARLVCNDGACRIYNQTAVRSEPNPILINGVEREQADLVDGDTVSIGGVEFTFRAEAS